MRRLLAAPIVAGLWLALKAIEALDAVMYDPGAEAWKQYEDADECTWRWLT